MWYERINKRIMIWTTAVLCLGAVVLVTVLSVHALQGEKPRLVPDGDAVVQLEPGQSFQDPGAKLVFPDGSQVQDVIVESAGSVNSQQLGTYWIKYKAQYKDRVFTAYRSVRVEDRTAPEITLQETPNGYTLPGEPYREEGFTATDDRDGDLTHLVRRSEKNGVVTYAVQDSAGNKTVVERRIRYKDTVAPVVTVQGNMVISLAVGEAFQEPGYSAKDNLEGDITGYVTVSGSVDNQKPGVYTLKYQVKDSFGNLGAAERIVCVIAPDQAVKPNGKVIYLTFDDGPSQHTERLLQVLEQYNVKATFFVVNTGYIGTVEQIAAAGHTVAIHTKTHRYEQIYSSDQAYFEDLYAMQSVIEKYTGQKPMLLRFPGGTSNTVSRQYSKGIMTRLSQKVTQRGFRYFDWNVDSRDAGGARTAEDVVANVVAGIGNKQVSVVLQHDLYGYSVDAVEQIIIWGQAQGYTFAPLTEGSPPCEHSPNN